MTTTLENRTMYDSVNLYAIPRPLPAHSIIAFYLDGPRAVASIKQVDTLFPGVRQNPIDVNGTRANYARTVDCETLDVPAGELEQWLTDFKDTNPGYEHGARGIVYTDRDNIPAVRQGTGRYVLAKDYYLWVATGDGTLYTGEGVVACQYRWLRDYDVSAVFDPRFLPD